MTRDKAIAAMEICLGKDDPPDCRWCPCFDGSLEHEKCDEARAIALDLLKSLKGEPKHGHWVKVDGYVTPGGDSVWKCSECGKGLHVYGIEYGTYGADVADGQWVTCPNCGSWNVEDVHDEG